MSIETDDQVQELLNEKMTTPTTTNTTEQPEDLVSSPAEGEQVKSREQEFDDYCSKLVGITEEDIIDSNMEWD